LQEADLRLVAIADRRYGGFHALTLLGDLDVRVVGFDVERNGTGLLEVLKDRGKLVLIRDINVKWSNNRGAL
jgi:hypothetical protein